MHQDFRLDTLIGFDLHGKTIGIIGTGTIGTVFAKIMKGFGTSILAYDPVRNHEALNTGVKYVSFEEVLKSCDVISIHCPLNAKTRYMFSAEQFSMMKKGGIIINTARGAQIQTAHLLDAIENGHVGGACLDVYENEKKLFFQDHSGEEIEDTLFLRLRSNKNILLTGHQAFLTNEALRDETTLISKIIGFVNTYRKFSHLRS